MGLRLTCVVAAALAMGIAGCEEKNSGQIYTSVPESKPVNDLDPEEQQDVCEDVRDWADGRITPDLFQRVECIGEAVQAATEGGGLDPAACRSAYSECTSRPYETEVFDFGSLECQPGALPDCDITVGEYLSCAEDSYAILTDVLAAFDCNNLDELAELDYSGYPESCMFLQESCAES